jgi:hypothetical protein
MNFKCDGMPLKQPTAEHVPGYFCELDVMTEKRLHDEPLRWPHESDSQG